MTVREEVKAGYDLISEGVEHDDEDCLDFVYNEGRLVGMALCGSRPRSGTSYPSMAPDRWPNEGNVQSVKMC